MNITQVNGLQTYEAINQKKPTSRILKIVIRSILVLLLVPILFAIILGSLVKYQNRNVRYTSSWEIEQGNRGGVYEKIMTVHGLIHPSHEWTGIRTHFTSGIDTNYTQAMQLAEQFQKEDKVTYRVTQNGNTSCIPDRVFDGRPRMATQEKIYILNQGIESLISIIESMRNSENYGTTKDNYIFGEDFVFLNKNIKIKRNIESAFKLIAIVLYEPFDGDFDVSEFYVEWTEMAYASGLWGCTKDYQIEKISEFIEILKKTVKHLEAHK